MTACPCDPARRYADCCGRLHQGAPAADAEALMRSRYSAYALGLADYVLASWHPSTRPETLELGAPGATRWLGLEVRAHRPQGDRATVEFVARYRVGGGSAVRLHELSRFLREHGRWTYLDGSFPNG
ncbi:YchJ family protein [Lysobacter silvisoli]|uniref:UPF0225 protein DX914_16090 n=1 Tax=Lysobacter silvisoli TaxID=2293254 RepID=A0A371JXW1_9GAMM|nr:YchJ family metal-binding protein [Lysobacter silvisoli]RDZ26509.1 hypothetical protein DX914_16090 [Lysobacter silvisoli]